MPKLVLTNTRVTLGSTDITDCVAAVTLNATAAEVETTSFGGSAVTRVGGLQDNSVTLSIMNDFSYVEGVVYPLVGSTAQINIRANGTTLGTANPGYTATVLVTEWSPVNGAVGELNTADVTWPISGTITKATS